jgi:hypothetical protein
VLEDGLAIVLDMLVVLDTGERLRQQRFEPRLALMQRPWPELLVRG